MVMANLSKVSDPDVALPYLFASESFILINLALLLGNEGYHDKNKV